MCIHNHIHTLCAPVCLLTLTPHSFFHIHCIHCHILYYIYYTIYMYRLPSCPVIMYHGAKSERERIRIQNLPLSNQKSFTFPVVITSFEICMIDRMYLEKYTWQYLILDEGHRIKNRNCRLVSNMLVCKSNTIILQFSIIVLTIIYQNIILVYIIYNIL